MKCLRLLVDLGLLAFKTDGGLTQRLKFVRTVASLASEMMRACRDAVGRLALDARGVETKTVGCDTRQPDFIAGLEGERTKFHRRVGACEFRLVVLASAFETSIRATSSSGLPRRRDSPAESAGARRIWRARDVQSKATSSLAGGCIDHRTGEYVFIAGRLDHCDGRCAVCDRVHTDDDIISGADRVLINGRDHKPCRFALVHSMDQCVTSSVAVLSLGTAPAKTAITKARASTECEIQRLSGCGHRSAERKVEPHA